MLRNPWVLVAALVSGLVAMLAVIEVCRRRFALHAEVTRKAGHIGLGLATLSFPILFDSVWPVVTIGLIVVASLAAIRWVPAIGRCAGKVVHGIDRRSGGELYFPIAATALFVVTKGDPILFGIPILTLTLADAVAAIVGISYGRIRYATGEAPKSIEGSAAFFAVAFLTIHVPLLLLTETGWPEAALIGLVCGILVTLLEAVSLRGTDNLLIPFGGYALLARFLERSVSELLAALIVTLVLLAVFLSYTILWPRRRLIRRHPYEVVAIAAVLASALGLALRPSSLGFP